MTDLILIFAVVLPTVALGIWWVLRPQKPADQPVEKDVPAILFRDGVIEHATDSALANLPIAIGAHNWADLHNILVPHYPDFPPVAHAKDCGELVLKGNGSDIEIIWHENGATVLFHGAKEQSVLAPDLEELKVLRQVSEHLPYPVWKLDKSGALVWHNDAYAALRKRLPKASDNHSGHLFELPAIAGGSDTKRVKLALECPEIFEWFSVTRKPMSDGTFYHATSLIELIRAEEAQRDFVQTLAKTFAHLSIGLAIFNRDRQLALFNPALVDLTSLSVSFLSPRPTIDSFFDAMRENRRMPEPKTIKPGANGWRI
ncbi:hypothetical protein [Sulfitobacter guttiformis]|uniref:PAS domain-containing protein n=1 Tax=Sulfitobacter guttiformis TaxID=74349 RepID=A0A420DSC9_9RHOB|nr:hypothetical protein [Sulfitobacter guttiformis]KIN74452.1 PAS domain containing protein [Sulfitobacter guttiformis KCTC 32187]RKE97049.1 hypothetical protein C8N30_1631 [Sulfitobacter guttiformis]